MPFDTQTSLASPTGAVLNLCATVAKGVPRGVIQVNHGLAEHAARYGRFAEAMSAQGFHVYAHDHRGHGATRAPDAPAGIFGKDGVKQVVADVAAVHDRIARDHPGLPIIVFGHSMGGLVALNFVLRHPGRVAAAAIWNANLTAGLLGRVARAMLAWERLRLGSDLPSRFLPALTFQAWAKKIPDRRTEFDWLSRDAAEVDKYVADPLCGWNASVSMWTDVFRFIFAGADHRNFSDVGRSLPFDLVGGERDPASDGGRAVRDLEQRLRRMGFSDVTTTIYAETRHESLNEVNRDAITRDFAAWATSVVARTGVAQANS
jgi:alpha-beta hydrolase superfamily lysophospholipase